MLKPIQPEALELRRHIRDAEALLDETSIALAAMKLKMLQLRQRPDVEVGTGQRAMIRLAKAEQAVTDGMTELLRVHDELSKLAVEKSIMDEAGSTEKKGLSDSDLIRKPVPA